MNKILTAKDYLTECCHLSDYSLYKDEGKTLNDYIYVCPICDEEQVVYKHGETSFYIEINSSIYWLWRSITS